MKIAQVVVSISNENVDKLFDYRIESGMDVKEGTRVVVPFGIGNVKLRGYVMSVSDDTRCDEKKLKSVLNVIDDAPLISKEMLETARWMKRKYHTTYAKCLQSILPAGMKSKKTLSKTVKLARLALEAEETEEIIRLFYENKSQRNQARVLELLYENGKTGVEEIKESLFISDTPIKTLQKKGLIEVRAEEVKKSAEMMDGGAFTESGPVTLNKEQEYIYNELRLSLESGGFNHALIHGITGSGKTEIYLRLIEDALRLGKQAVMLVPEISLTPQTVARFQNRFGSIATVTHSRMTLGERYEQWKAALNGEVSITIGPRSAVFAPYENLGVIIIDEEHEHSYKSEITPKYDAREVAEERMRLSGGLLVMGTATPSVETYYRAQKGEIKLYKLSKRAKASPLPEVTVVDMRRELLNGNRSVFSKLLRDEIEGCLESGEQAMLFLNRRGFASFVSCRRCGQAIKCNSCNVSYTYHKSGDFLLCHFCGEKVPNPKKCPHCGSEFIKQFGAGTQKIEEEIQKLFPTARTLRMDYDTVAGKNGKNAYETILGSFASGGADILIGTQMIAKGHDFAGVTLVGIVAADISLNSGGFKCAETTFQLMTQVSGRAGRADLPGKVVAQTYNPEHYAIEHAKTQDYEGFYAEEIQVRKRMDYPPFTKLFVVQITGENEKEVVVALHALARIMERYKSRGDYETIGPAPCYVSKVKNRYRWRIIVKSANEEKLVNFCVYCAEKLKKAGLPEGLNVSLTLSPNNID